MFVFFSNDQTQKNRGGNTSMNNILDYVKWRGDIPLTMVHFNEVDSLILSELSYLFWERALSADEFKKLESVYYEIKSTNYTRTISADEDKQLLELCASCVLCCWSCMLCCWSCML